MVPMLMTIRLIPLNSPTFDLGAISETRVTYTLFHPTADIPRKNARNPALKIDVDSDGNKTNRTDDKTIMSTRDFNLFFPNILLLSDAQMILPATAPVRRSARKTSAIRIWKPLCSRNTT